jgi:hypothetical protein
MTQGTHTIKVEYFENSGGAMAQVGWVVSTPPPALTCDTVSNNAFTGCYYDNMDLTNLLLTRTDAAVNFDWGQGSPDPSIGPDTFSTRWQGNFDFNASNYAFTVTADDGVRLYIDSNLVLDKWINQAPTTYTVNQVMTQGTHTIKVEYFENSGGAMAKVSWISSNPNPLIISDVITSGITANSAIITWTTNIPADSAVDYGKTISYGSTITNANLVTTHQMVLTGLSAKTRYHYRVRSKDAAGNQQSSSDVSFVTLRR